jgi:hypothetical protein
LLTRIVGADTGEGLGELVGDGGGALDFEGDAGVEAEVVLEEDGDGDVKESLGEKQQGAGGGGGVLDGTRQQLEEEAKVGLAGSSWLVGS